MDVRPALLAAGAAAAIGYLIMSKKREVRAVTYVSPESPVVLIQYEDIINGADLTAPLEAAFGPDGLGIIAVRGVPKLAELRQRLLPLAYRFANLDDKTKAKYEHKESTYSFGWSHGKEQFNGKPDYSKGSYYNNPLYDDPFQDPELAKKYPSFACPNIWPTEVPELRSAFMDLGKMMVATGAELAKHCDKFVSRRLPTYAPDRLHKIITKSRTPKARLLYYFPRDPKEPAPAHDDDIGNWCGWHNDHGSLTALCPAMYFGPDGQEVKNPDQQAGLYIKSRRGNVVKASIPTDCLAFQMGETEQIHSAGRLQATPHAVRSSAMAGVGRATYAVFMEPEWGESMATPEGTNPNDACRGSSSEFLPRGVPPLETRWSTDMDFGQFSEHTLATYAVLDKQMAQKN